MTARERVWAAITHQPCDRVPCDLWLTPEIRQGLLEHFGVDDIAVGARHRVSFAVRWHGERPAVLWEVDGPPGLTLRSGVDDSWSTTESRGEALWNVPRRPPTTLSVGSQSLS